VALVVFTGGARSGKSAVAQRLVRGRGGDVTVAVFGRAAGDAEMADRIERHRRDRPASWRVVEATDASGWMPEVGPGTLLLDCLGTLLALVMEECATADEVTIRLERVLDWIGSRDGDTVVVTNEVGDGIVPMHASARLFRDVLGRANRKLVERADAAYLVVAGRCVDLSALPTDVNWPVGERDA
jgi:adenosyl cobinamide kinase/adenosyl cobinamide phosphate guanylyltransferase